MEARIYCFRLKHGAAAPHPAERTPARPRLGSPPNPHQGGFSPPVPQRSGGRFPNQTINYNPMNHTAPGNSY